MKKIFLLIIISFFVDVCEKGNFLVYPKHEYSFIAKVDNEYWQGNCYLYLTPDQKQTLFLEPDNIDGYLYIELKFHGIGEYPINAPTNLFTPSRISSCSANFYFFFIPPLFFSPHLY